jgi:hypothetical protein
MRERRIGHQLQPPQPLGLAQLGLAGQGVDIRLLRKLIYSQTVDLVLPADDAKGGTELLIGRAHEKTVTARKRSRRGDRSR